MEDRDTRGQIVIDPNVELQDYSGPFKPDLRYSDFSRERLARMYLMGHEYLFEIYTGWMRWVTQKYGEEAMIEANNYLWGTPGICTESSHRILMGRMNIKDGEIESMMKLFQMDTTSSPGRFFDVSYEMPSKDRGIMTFNRCVVVDMFEDKPDTLRKICEEMCPPSIIKMAQLVNPEIQVDFPVIPPRKSKDDICCQVVLTYKSKDPK